MVLNILLLLILPAIIVFFIDEIGATIKKYGSIPVLALCIPLFIASSLILHFYMYFFLGLLAINHFFVKIVHGTVHFLPKYPIMKSIAEVCILWILTVLPSWILEAWSLRHRYEPFPYSKMISVIVWIILSCLVVVLN